MKIVLCGSMSFSKEMLEMKKSLNLNNIVLLGRAFDEYAAIFGITDPMKNANEVLIIRK